MKQYEMQVAMKLKFAPDFGKHFEPDEMSRHFRVIYQTREALYENGERTFKTQ